MKLISTAVAILAVSTMLAACTTGQQDATVSALEVGLAAAETGATPYKQLPTCGIEGQVTSKLCSDPTLIAQLTAYDNTAYAALKAAEVTAATGAPVDLTAAAAALTAFQGLIATLPKQN